MKFVGVDLHKQTISLCVMDRERQVLLRKTLSCRDVTGIRECFAALGEFTVVVEATASYEWFLEVVEPLAARVVLAHPGKLRVIAESTRKSDKLDAEVLATFLALDMIPPAYRPTPRQREHRLLVRRRQQVRQQIAQIKNRLRRLAGDLNADRPDLFTVEGEAHLRKLPFSAAARFAVEQLCRQRAFLLEQLREVDGRLKEFAKDAPSREAEDRELLQSIPGVGTVTSDIVISEVGDVRRFRRAGQLAAYAGLSPGQRESAGKRKDLHIEKRGSRLLRWALVEASWTLVRYSPHWREVFERIARHTGRRKKAIVAIARRLLGVMHSMLRNRQPFRSDGLRNAAA
jgi:transposase